MAGPAEEVLRPETEAEGASLPLKASVAGAMKGRENALRDPAVFEDADGRVYLLYSVAGEAGLGIAELTYSPRSRNDREVPGDFETGWPHPVVVHGRLYIRPKNIRMQHGRPGAKTQVEAPRQETH